MTDATTPRRPRRRLRSAAVLLPLVAVLVVTGAAAAQALSNPYPYGTFATGACTTAYGSDPAGYQPKASLTGNVNVSESQITDESWTSFGDAGADCGVGGYEGTAATMIVTDTFILTGASLKTCSAGFPANFSCSYGYNDVTLSVSTTCTQTSHCPNDGGPVTFEPGDGGKFSSYDRTVSVQLEGPGGSSYFFNTPQGGVDNF